MLVTVREQDCIGCTKCIQACPVDAILGSLNQMHTVIANECIGCELCLPACPVDCIDLVADAPISKNKELTLKRARARKERLANEEKFAIHTTTLERIRALKKTARNNDIITPD